MIQDQETDNPSKMAPESGEEETQLSRASFLTQLGRAAAAFAFGAPPVCMALTTRIEHKINDDPEIPLEAGHYFDVEVTINSAPAFRIIGTTHTDEDYKALRPHLNEVVSESDIILYEEAINPNQFFNLVAKEATQQGKRAIAIDSSNPYLRASWCALANGAGIYVAADEIRKLYSGDAWLSIQKLLGDLSLECHRSFRSNA